MHLKSKHTEILQKVACRLEDVNQPQKRASPAVVRARSACKHTPPGFVTGCCLKGYCCLFNLQPPEKYERRAMWAPSREHVEGQPKKSHITRNCCSTWLPSISHQCEKDCNGTKAVVPTLYRGCFPFPGSPQCVPQGNSHLPLTPTEPVVFLF